MTNWHDPDLEAAEDLVVNKLFHVFAGIYIWEFVLNLDYEYSIITRKRKFNLSVPLYLGCRWFTLLTMITRFVYSDSPNGVNCEAWFIAASVISYITFHSSACLIILRVYALWEHKRIIVVVGFVIWLANTIVFVYGIVIGPVHRDGTVCVYYHVLEIRFAILGLFITDVVLLSLMLFGVLRWKQDHLTGGIWQVMYTQGLIYMVVAALAYTPSVTFLFLNLNGFMNLMFMFPSTIILSVCALRMYRGLVDSSVLHSPRITRLSTIRFAPLDFRNKEDAHKTRGTFLDPSPVPNEVLHITRQNEECSRSETT